MATRKTTYRASANLTVTNLNSLAASSSLTAGWTSGTIDNTTDLDLDKLVSAQFTTGSANAQAGEIRVYVYVMLDDSTWPDIFSSGTEGTEGTATCHDTEQRDAAMKLMWSTQTDTGTSEPFNMPQTSIAQFFSGNMPAKCALFVTHTAHTSTNAIASSGNQVTVKGVSETVA